MRESNEAMFYDEVLKAIQDSAKRWMREDRRTTFKVEVYCTKKLRNWVVAVKKG